MVAQVDREAAAPRDDRRRIGRHREATDGEADLVLVVPHGVVQRPIDRNRACERIAARRARRGGRGVPAWPLPAIPSPPNVRLPWMPVTTPIGIPACSSSVACSIWAS